MDDLKDQGVMVPRLVDHIAGLLFVDDLALLADSNEELKSMLRIIYESASKWGMQCRIDKSKGMVLLGNPMRLKMKHF